MGEWIDLHVHSTCSDGTCAPGELVSLALEKGLRSFRPDRSRYRSGD
ncbi:MAG: hypothetical protein ACLSEX_06530 [Blautia sp.]